jgi:hypothetical protein
MSTSFGKQRFNSVRTIKSDVKDTKEIVIHGPPCSSVHSLNSEQIDAEIFVAA